MCQTLPLKIRKSTRISKDSPKLLLAAKQVALEDAFLKQFRGNLFLKNSLLDREKVPFRLEDCLEIYFPQIRTLNSR